MAPFMPADLRVHLLRDHLLRRRPIYQTEKVHASLRRQVLPFGAYAGSIVMML